MYDIASVDVKMKLHACHPFLVNRIKKNRQEALLRLPSIHFSILVRDRTRNNRAGAHLQWNTEKFSFDVRRVNDIIVVRIVNLTNGNHLETLVSTFR